MSGPPGLFKTAFNPRSSRVAGSAPCSAGSPQRRRRSIRYVSSAWSASTGHATFASSAAFWYFKPLTIAAASAGVYSPVALVFENFRKSPCLCPPWQRRSKNFRIHGDELMNLVGFFSSSPWVLHLPNAHMSDFTTPTSFILPISVMYGSRQAALPAGFSRRKCRPASLCMRHTTFTNFSSRRSSSRSISSFA